MRSFLRWGQMHVAAVALGATVGAAALAGVPMRPAVAVLAGCGAWAFYVAERLVARAPEDVLNHPERTVFFAAHRLTLAVGVGLALLACAAAWWRLPAEAQAAAAGVALIGAVYTLPAVRRSSLAKTTLVASAWGLGAGLLPTLAARRGVDGQALLVALAVALLVATNALLLDGRDARGDREAGRRTFATDWTARRYWALVALIWTAAGAVVLAAVVRAGPPWPVGAFVPHTLLAVAAIRSRCLRPTDALWLDLAVGTLGLAALMR